MQMSGLTPRWSSPPGDTIKAALLERGMRISDLTDLLGLSPQDVSDLLEGRLSINFAIARSLESVLGGSIEFWITRDAQYLDDKELVKADQWCSGLPTKQMVEFGWLSKTEDWQQRIAACFQFFAIRDLDDFDANYSGLIREVRYLSSPSFKIDEVAAAVWFRACERYADDISIAHDYRPLIFSESLLKVRDLTRIKRPEVFVPKLVELCAASGVLVALVRAPDGLPVSGAARIYENRPLIQLTARFLSDDHFWFTFFHEAGHILLHSLDLPHIDLDTLEAPALSDNIEREASDFASERLIGNYKFRTGPFSHQDVLKIAHELNISPGIIVGQLQHLGRVPRSHLNRLKRRYIWEGANLGTAQR